MNMILATIIDRFCCPFWSAIAGGVLGGIGGAMKRKPPKFDAPPGYWNEGQMTGIGGQAHDLLGQRFGRAIGRDPMDFFNYYFAPAKEAATAATKSDTKRIMESQIGMGHSPKARRTGKLVRERQRQGAADVTRAATQAFPAAYNMMLGEEMATLGAAHPWASGAQDYNLQSKMAEHDSRVARRAAGGKFENIFEGVASGLYQGGPSGMFGA